MDFNYMACRRSMYNSLDTAKEALQLLASQTFDVLLTDISLPDLRGDELAVQAISSQPTIRVIFASGYDAPAAGEQRAALRGAIYLRKPYNQDALDQALRRSADPSLPSDQ